MAEMPNLERLSSEPLAGWTWRQRYGIGFFEFKNESNWNLVIDHE
jgi:hypothetical protein